MLPGGICNQPLKTAATRALAALCACVVAMAKIRRGLSIGRAVQKFRTPAKRAAAVVAATAATVDVEVAKAPLHAHGTTTGILLFLDEKLYM